MSVAREPVVDLALAREHGLSESEYATLLGFLGRTPTWTELGVTSALWSEHCSYKSSKVYLREFPTSGPRVLQGPGENAGAVDVGHGWVAVFKMESHNHPSYIEPYQGAATGVGGILRDVFTMGARPIACLDSLHFGRLDAPRMRGLVDGVVRGIGDYGNCVGIPTVGGATQFHSCYDGNILVNAFALGVARRDRLFRAKATGEGNPVLYAGSRTGRDGIHGATMASDSFDAASEHKRPTVQVGDPFTEKVLLEATLEAMRTGGLIAVQDMGAAGLTSSTFEMAARGGTGLRLDLERVPLREAGLTPYEMMLSESQERMVLVAQRGREEEVARVFRKWGLEVETIGEITSTGRAELRHHGRVFADIPITPVTEEAPLYRRPAEPPADLARRQAPPEVPPPPGGVGDCLKRLMASVELGSKEWIWRQYDHTVRAATVRGPGSDAAVLRLHGTPSALALTTDVNSVYCALDPRSGGRQAIAAAVRNLACVGAEPIGVTDCLNFGDPEIPEVSWQLREAVRGLAEACRAFEVPVVSGNVSLYNDTQGRSIHPTPTVAMVGLIETLGALPSSSFERPGDRLLLLGKDFAEFGGSTYLRLLFDVEQGMPPHVDLEAEVRLARALRDLVRSGLVSMVHDLARGGLGAALARCSFGRGIGCEVRWEQEPARLFSESQARALLAVAPAEADRVGRQLEKAGVPFEDLGAVGGDCLRIGVAGDRAEISVADLNRSWAAALPRALDL